MYSWLVLIDFKYLFPSNCLSFVLASDPLVACFDQEFQLFWLLVEVLAFPASNTNSSCSGVLQKFQLFRLRREVFGLTCSCAANFSPIDLLLTACPPSPDSSPGRVTMFGNTCLHFAHTDTNTKQIQRQTQIQIHVQIQIKLQIQIQTQIQTQIQINTDTNTNTDKDTNTVTNINTNTENQDRNTDAE